MVRYDIHEFAALVPAMADSEYDAFREDIRVNGLMEAIILFEGKILDGSHRQRACDETGVPALHHIRRGAGLSDWAWD